MHASTAVEEPLAHTIDEILTKQLLPIGRNTLFKLIQSGELRSIKAGRRRLIPHSALVDFVEGGTDAVA